MANKIRLNVGGIDYIITSNDEETYVRKIGEELSDKLGKLTRECPYLSTTMVAVLAALEYCDGAKKAQKALEEVKLEQKTLAEEVACLRLETDEARREIERLTKENRQLRMNNSSL